MGWVRELGSGICSNDRKAVRQNHGPGLGCAPGCGGYGNSNFEARHATPVRRRVRGDI